MRYDIKLRLAVLLFLVLGVTQVASAGTFEDSKAAFDRGDYATALQLVRPLAEQGDARSEAGLGAMYATGRGVTQDYAEAVKWYRLAAQQGNAHGQAGLGYMYATGKGGIPSDFSEAIRWYRLSADQGYAFAQIRLGYSYLNGLGVQRDYTEALRWYRLAASQGLAIAQNNLGVMYQKGYGVPKDDDQALQWYRLAAKQGDRNAQANIDLIEQSKIIGVVGVIFLVIFFTLSAMLVCWFARRLWLGFSPATLRAFRHVVNFVWQSPALIRHGTALQRVLSRCWMVLSAGWVMHSFWWIGAHCESGYEGYDCSSGTFHIEHAHLSTLDVLGYVLTMPAATLFAVVAAHWVMLGFAPREGQPPPVTAAADVRGAESAEDGR